MATITVIDAQGGGVGKSLVRMLKQAAPQVKIIAAGTNALATAAMLKAGADVGATGENAVVYNIRRAQILLAPMGIMLANAMHGEITATMSVAFGESDAKKILVPVKQDHVYIAGLLDRPLLANLEDAVNKALAYAGQPEAAGANADG